MSDNQKPEGITSPALANTTPASPASPGTPSVPTAAPLPTSSIPFPEVIPGPTVSVFTSRAPRFGVFNPGEIFDNVKIVILEDDPDQAISFARRAMKSPPPIVGTTTNFQFWCHGYKSNIPSNHPARPSLAPPTKGSLGVVMRIPEEGRIGIHPTYYRVNNAFFPVQMALAAVNECIAIARELMDEYRVRGGSATVRIFTDSAEGLRQIREYRNRGHNQVDLNPAEAILSPILNLMANWAKELKDDGNTQIELHYVPAEGIDEHSLAVLFAKLPIAAELDRQRGASRAA